MKVLFYILVAIGIWASFMPLFCNEANVPLLVSLLDSGPFYIYLASYLLLKTKPALIFGIFIVSFAIFVNVIVQYKTIGCISNTDHWQAALVFGFVLFCKYLISLLVFFSTLYIHTKKKTTIHKSDDLHPEEIKIDNLCSEDTIIDNSIMGAINKSSAQIGNRNEIKSLSIISKIGIAIITILMLIILIEIFS